MTRGNKRRHGSDTIHTLIGSRLNRLKYVWGLFLDPLATHSRAIFGINQTYIQQLNYTRLWAKISRVDSSFKHKRNCVQSFRLFLIFKQHGSGSLEQTASAPLGSWQSWYRCGESRLPHNLEPRRNLARSSHFLGTCCGNVWKRNQLFCPKTEYLKYL